MKKVLFFSFIILLLVTSCQKEENVIMNDTNRIKAKMLALATPSKDEIATAISTGNQSGIKKAPNDEGYNSSPVLVEIFPLDVSTYEVEENSAVKYFVYYEINDGYRKKFLTISQEFTLKNGEIDESNYILRAQISCPMSRIFYLESSQNTNQIVYFFHFDDGNQFVYYGSNNDDIKLPPIANGKWQLKVSFSDNDMYQEFTTLLVDYFSSSNIIMFDYDLKKENTSSVVSMSKELIQNSYYIQFIGLNDDGSYNYFSYQVIYGENLNEIISFKLPIKNITRVVICGNNGCIHYFPVTKIEKNGIDYYSIAQNNSAQG